MLSALSSLQATKYTLRQAYALETACWVLSMEICESLRNPGASGSVGISGDCKRISTVHLWDSKKHLCQNSHTYVHGSLFWGVL